MPPPDNQYELDTPIWFEITEDGVELPGDLSEALQLGPTVAIDRFASRLSINAEAPLATILRDGGSASILLGGRSHGLVVGPLSSNGKRPAMLDVVDPDSTAHLHHRRFEALVDLVPIGVTILDPEGRPVFANGELHRILGFSENRANPSLASGLLHTDDLDRVTDSFAAFQESARDAWTERFRVVTGDGTVRVVENGCRRVRDADGQTLEFVGYLEHLDEDRVVGLDVNPSSDRERETLAVGRVGHWSWESTDDRLTFSDTMQQIYGLESVEGVSTDSVENLIPAEQRLFVRREVELAIKESRSWEAEHDIITPGGDLRRVISRGRAFSNGDNVRLVGMAIDVTAQREREQQVRQAEKLRAIGQLASGVAHDFNNMLGAIVGNATVLSEEVPPALQRPVAEIQIAAERVSQMTRKLLTFSRQQQLERAPNDIHVLLDEIFALVAHSFASGIEIKRQFRAERSRVLCDPSQLQSAFLNIAVNARDAMQRSGGCLEVETRNVDDESSDWVEIIFRDNGPGMSEETRRRAFEPFFTTRRDEGGTGLGLSATYGAILRHGGTIALDSREGEGTLFTIRFQTLHSDQDDDQVLHRSSKDDSGSGRTIWLVDDEPLMRSLATRVFERASYEVVAFESAEGVLAAIEHEAPDVFLIDHHMPSMSGLVLIERLRDRGIVLPIVMVTGNAFEIDAAWADRVGVRSVVEKPYAVSDLLDAIES